MAIEQISKQIGETTYLITQMNGVKALKIQTMLLKLLGGSVAKMPLDDFAKITQGVDGKPNVAAIAAVLTPLLENVDDELLFNFIMQLFEKGIFVQGTDQNTGQKIPIPVNFETHFVGKPQEMWKMVWAILEANFATGN